MAIRHATVASRHQHRFSINVCVGILGDQPLGPVVLPNRLTGAVYRHYFLVNVLPALFFNDSTFGSCMMGHRLIFSTLSDSTRTKLSVNSGEGAEARSTGLRELVNLIPEFLAVRTPEDFTVFSADQ
jgi:hypothetical protein